MMEKEKTRHLLTTLSVGDLEGPIEDAIDILKEYANDPIAITGTIEIFENFDGYSDRSYLEIWCYKWETNDELANRIALEKQMAQNKRNAAANKVKSDKATLKRLLKKYGAPK